MAHLHPQRKIEERLKNLQLRAEVHWVLQRLHETGCGTISSLTNMLSLVEADELIIERLSSAHHYFDKQLAEIRAKKRTLVELKEMALIICETLVNESSKMSAERLLEIRETMIDRFILCQQKEEYRTLRIKGPMVDKVSFKCRNSSYPTTRILLDILEACHAEFRGGNEDLSDFWRWYSKDVSTEEIWFYHHSDFEKWKCIFFRISVRSSGRGRTLYLESFVPFGYGKDPANYQLEASSVYQRPGWTLTLVTSETTSTQTTETEQQSYSTNRGVSVGEGRTSNKNTTEGESSGLTESLNWGVASGETWSNTNYSSMTLNPLSASSGSSAGSSSSFNQTFSGGSGKSTAKNYSTSLGEALNYQTTLNDSIGEVTSSGISFTSSRSLQVTCWAYGINFAVSSKQHLEKWKEKNQDARDLYDRAWDLLSELCEAEMSHLDSISYTAKPADSPSALGYLEKVKSIVPVACRNIGSQISEVPIQSSVEKYLGAPPLHNDYSSED
ncbi:MAG: hypothetical protein IPK73_23365 [Candidatus Obscuribacter sp.]|nr:hypothetical protein [Candidatus Obscuribacter sp.]MBK9277053.1 hypothetical protein [Candidatus Obscuribacter sp.]